MSSFDPDEIDPKVQACIDAIRDLPTGMTTDGSDRHFGGVLAGWEMAADRLEYLATKGLL